MVGSFEGLLLGDGGGPSPVSCVSACDASCAAWRACCTSIAMGDLNLASLVSHSGLSLCEADAVHPIGLGWATR